jgi:hypothetical protein
MRDGGDLAAHRIHQDRMRVTERVNGDAGEKVEIPLAVGIPDVTTLAANQQGEWRSENAHHRGTVPLAPSVGIELVVTHFAAFVSVPFVAAFVVR